MFRSPSKPRDLFHPGCEPGSRSPCRLLAGEMGPKPPRSYSLGNSTLVYFTRVLMRLSRQRPGAQPPPGNASRWSYTPPQGSAAMASTGKGPDPDITAALPSQEQEGPPAPRAPTPRLWTRQGPRTGPHGGAGSHGGPASRRRGAKGNVGATGPVAHTTPASTSFLSLGTAQLTTPSPPLRRAAQRPQNHTPLRLLMALTHHVGTVSHDTNCSSEPLSPVLLE